MKARLVALISCGLLSILVIRAIASHVWSSGILYFILFYLLAVMIPFECHILLPNNKALGILLSLCFTPIVVGFTLYLSVLNDPEGMAWMPVVFLQFC